jgi:hypothetical protein
LIRTRRCPIYTVFIILLWFPECIFICWWSDCVILCCCVDDIAGLCVITWCSNMSGKRVLPSGCCVNIYRIVIRVICWIISSSLDIASRRRNCISIQSLGSNGARGKIRTGCTSNRDIDLIRTVGIIENESSIRIRLTNIYIRRIVYYFQ